MAFANGAKWFFVERDWSQKKVSPWQQHGRCHSVHFRCKFKGHCFNISGDILDSVLNCLSVNIYDIITFLIYIIQNVDISKTNRDIYF